MRRLHRAAGGTGCLLLGVVLAVPASGAAPRVDPPVRSTTPAFVAPDDPDLVPASRRRPKPAAVPATALHPAPAAPVAARPAPDACSGDGWQQRRGEAALRSLRPEAQRSGFRVIFSAAREGYLGITWTRERRIDVFVRSCRAQSDALLRGVLAHELGHALDAARMDEGSRAAWKRARGIPSGTPWAGCSGCSDFATPAGDFAEVFAQWVRGAADNRSRLAGAPGTAELDRLARQFFGG